MSNRVSFAGAGRGRAVVSPQPTKRLRQDRAAVLAVVPAVAVLETVIVLGKFQGGSHLLVRQRPIAVRVIQIARSILHEDADWLRLGLADQGRVDVPSPD